MFLRKPQYFLLFCLLLLKVLNSVNLFGIKSLKQIYHDQCSLKFFKVCVRIKFLLCNTLVGLICIWNDVYEICSKTFLEETFMCALCFFFVRSSHGLCVCSHVHSLEGTLSMIITIHV